MASISQRNAASPLVIKKFLGLNQDTTGETQLVLGESPYMRNYRVTENYKLTKRDGIVLKHSMGSGPIKAVWYGRIAGSDHFIFAHGGQLRKLNLVTEAVTNIGAISTSGSVCLFAFQGILFILDGTEIRKWDGTSLSVVTGYRPLIGVSSNPSGSEGTELELLNGLNGLRRKWFSGDGTSTTFALPEQSITSVDYVKVNGVTKTVTTDYSVNLTAGTVTFVTAPATGVPNNVDIGWTKGTGSRSEIARLTNVIPFGVGNDTRILGYGDPTFPNRIRHTGLADGLPSGEYWPSLGSLLVGSSQTPITGWERQYDRLNVYTETDAWYTTCELTEDALGRTVVAFATYPLHGSEGNITPGQVRLIKNQPITISRSGVMAWESSTVKDERNAVHISAKVQPSLDEEDLTTAITADWEHRGEYWLCIGSTVWIYNYRLGVWYMFDGIDAAGFQTVGKELYYWSPAGDIYRFDASTRSDLGNDIACQWQMHFYDFGADYRLKYLNRLWVSIQPNYRASVKISYETNKGEGIQTYEANYNLLTFLHMNFTKFGFQSSTNPRPFRFKVKAKKFVYFKLMLENISHDEVSTILSIDLSARGGGESK